LALEACSVPLTLKSHTLISPRALTSMFDGLMSRWMVFSRSFRKQSLFVGSEKEPQKKVSFRSVPWCCRWADDRRVK
jgi:hypothetical protein